MMTNSEFFLAGMVTGAALCLMLAVAVWARPRRPRRAARSGFEGASERGWMRAVEAAFVHGQEAGRAERLPKRELTIQRQGAGWRGTTRVGGLTQDDGRGPA